MIQGNYYVMVAALPILVFCTYSILNVQGVQFHTAKKLVRAYKLRIVGKTGVWKDLDSFTSILLDTETYSIHWLIPDQGMGENISEQHNHFRVILVDSKHLNNILLAEITDYQEARSFARNLASQIGKNFVDNFESRLQEAKFKKRR